MIIWFPVIQAIIQNLKKKKEFINIPSTGSGGGDMILSIVFDGGVDSLALWLLLSTGTWGLGWAVEMFCVGPSAMTKFVNRNMNINIHTQKKCFTAIFIFFN